MKKVIHIDSQVGGGSGTGYIGVFANYTALTTAYPTAPTLSLAYVQNSQGTAWLPGGLGGTFYSKGTYLFDGVNWVDGLDEVSEELQELIDNQYLIKVSSSDTTPNYLINKNEDTIDTFRLFINPGGDEKVGFNLFEYNKVWVTGPDPNSGDDDSIPKRHRIGQIWYATSTGKFFIAESIATGNAVWQPLQSITSTVDPTPADDISRIGQLWLNTITKRMWMCTDNTNTNAYWLPVFDKLSFKAFNTASQNINTLGPGTLINFNSDTILENNFLGITHTAGTPGITIGINGLYRIRYSISYELQTGSRQNIDSILNVNGSPNWEFDSLSYVRSSDRWGNNRAESDVNLSAGDVLELNALRIGSAGTNLTYTPATYIEIELIKPN